MNSDPALPALVQQAIRNANTLELLVANAGGADDVETVRELQARLTALKAECTKETDALTLQVLRRAIERRRGPDRRRTLAEAGEPVFS